MSLLWQNPHVVRSALLLSVGGDMERRRPSLHGALRFVFTSSYCGTYPAPFLDVHDVKTCNKNFYQFCRSHSLHAGRWQSDLLESIRGLGT